MAKTAATTFLISRTDSIGDVVLTLPLCTWIKEQYPNSKIIFLGNTYTRPVLECFPMIDEVIEWKKIEELPLNMQIQFIKDLKIDTCIHVFPRKEVAKLLKKAGIPVRIGTSHRLYHWWTCNVHPNFTRKNSDLHEAQLNFELLKPLGLTEIPDLDYINHSLASFQAKEITLPITLADGEKIILHPKSQGSAREWPMEKYAKLALQLVAQGKHVYFTGTAKEGDLFRKEIPQHANIHDVTGVFNLDQFIRFIAECNAIVACSTGPLHIGAVLGLRAVGIYSRTRPIHPGRWQPIGKDSVVLTYPDEPEDGEISAEYIQKISVESVLEKL